MICKRCKTPISDGLSTCPCCGKNPYKEESNIPGIILIVFLCAVIIGIGWYYFIYLEKANNNSAETDSMPFSSNITSVSTEVSESQTVLETQTAQETVSGENIVYVSSDGKKYHKKNCRYYRETFSETVVNDAEALGYTPCYFCFSDESTFPVTGEVTTITNTTSNVDTDVTTSNEADVSNYIETTVTETTKEPTTLGGEVVYITSSGKKYHKDGCRFIRGEKSEIGQKDAINSGYTKCVYCFDNSKTEKTTKSETTRVAETTVSQTKKENTNSKAEITESTIEQKIVYIKDNDEFYHTVDCPEADISNGYSSCFEGFALREGKQTCVVCKP